MISEIVCMFHDPLTLLGPLPLIYGFSGIDIRIFYIAYSEHMEVDLHACMITGYDLFTYEFGSHRKHSGYDLSAGPGYVLVLSLGSIGTSELDEMHP